MTAAGSYGGGGGTRRAGATACRTTGRVVCPRERTARATAWSTATGTGVWRGLTYPTYEEDYGYDRRGDVSSVTVSGVGATPRQRRWKHDRGQVDGDIHGRAGQRDGRVGATAWVA